MYNEEKDLKKLRDLRNEKLSKSDWIMIPNSSLTKEQKVEGIIYRQQLRDLPSVTIDYEFPIFPPEPDYLKEDPIPLDYKKNKTILLNYDNENKRLEFYDEISNKWLYIWSEFIVITEISSKPYFLEDFEYGWLIENTFINIFEEIFDNDWFINSPFNELFTEDFQGIDW